MININKLLLFLISIIAYSLALYVFCIFMPGREVSFEVFLEYIKLRQSHNLEGGSSINISEYSLLMQVFTFLYRPFFESFDIRYLVISFENLIYIILTGYLFINLKYLKLNFLNCFSIVFIIIFTLIMAMTTANLGIAVRLKIILIPMFFYLISVVYVRRKQLKE